MKQNKSRRKFVRTAATGVASIASAALYDRFAFAKPTLLSKKIRLGVIGGRFGLRFHFDEHPNCIVEAVSDLLPNRRNDLMDTYKCEKSYESLEKLLKDPNVEAVALFTPAPDHAMHAIQSLDAGKHVLCAVPAALTIDECWEVLEAVRRSGKKYMMAETSTYRQVTISAKKFYREGLFGEVFSSVGQYLHPGIESYFFEQGKPTWRHGLPPMLYPTHATAFPISVTGERLTEVMCIGWGDTDPILEGNPYGNPFWNEKGFFKTNRGNSFMAEVSWRGALAHCERGEWHGTKMSFYSAGNELRSHKVISSKQKGSDDAGFVVYEQQTLPHDQTNWWKTDMLPVSMQHDSGHGGSHTFITHEFIDSLVNDRQPEVDIYEALAYTAPGIIAHQSALKKGELMKIPDFEIYRTEKKS